jgi:hypothetical protein
MQFSISGIFQKNEQDLFGYTSLEIPRSFQRKIKALISSPLTFVILVWAMMFFVASLYFVYAQEVKTAAPSALPVSQKAHAGNKPKTAAKKHTAPAKKIEKVELFSVGLETLNTDFSRKAMAGEGKPNE